MKNLFLFGFVLCFALPVFSQQQSVYMPSEVKEMPVFPGCEKIKISKKNELNECIAMRLTDLLNNKMSNIEGLMNQHGISKAVAIIQFVISREGIILNITEKEGSNPILAQAAIDALDRISMEIKPIRPARLKSGEAVNIVYQLPVTYNFDEAVEEFYQFPVDEIVMFTLKGEEAVYEIRLFKNQSIKIYEIANGNQAYLGRFMNMNEVERSEPYKTLIENEKKSEKTLVAEGELEDGYYEIYIHNLFQKDKKYKPIYVEVEKVENGKRKSVQAFERENDFNKSKYAPLIYRK